MIPASEKGRRPLTAGEEGEIFELPDDIIEKEFRPVSLDQSKERRTASELKKIYFVYRLARQIMPDHFVETVGARKKDGSLRLYTRKVDVPEEDQEMKAHINSMMEKAHKGGITEREIREEISRFDNYVENKYPGAEALAQKYEEFGIEIPHWQMNALYDRNDGKIKFCEATLKTGQAGKLFNWIMENTEDPRNLPPRIESQLKIFVLDSFAYMEKNGYPLAEEEFQAVYVAVNKAMSCLLEVFRNNKADLKRWFRNDHLVATMFRLFNVEILLRNRRPENVIDFYEKITTMIKDSKIQDPGIVLTLGQALYNFERR